MHRHDLDLVSLIFGLGFTALGVAFLTDQVDAFNLEWRWVWPLVLIAVGLSTVLSARSRGVRNEPEQASKEDSREDLTTSG